MNNNCFDNKIKKILDCGKQCNCTPIIVGPTGPTGPQGPASIAVGVTTTTDPGTNASVTNVGTNDNVILNFNIPRGETGPIGPQGIPGTEAQRGQLDHRVFKAFKEYRDQQGQQDQLVLKEYLEQKVQQAQPDHKAFKDFKVYKVQLDQPDQQDPVEILQH